MTKKEFGRIKVKGNENLLICLTRSLPTIFHDVYHIPHIFHDVYQIYYFGPSHMPHDVFICHSKVLASEGWP